MKVRVKPLEYDAWQVSFAEPLPDWVSRLLRNGILYYQGGDNPYFTMRDEREYGYIRAPKWLVMVPGSDHPVVYSEEGFRQYYEPSPVA